MQLIRFFENDTRIKAYFTTRHGGVSSGEYASLNLGSNTGDDFANILSNRRALKEHLGINDAIEVRLNQVHGADVSVIDNMPNVAEEYRPGDYDGVITNQKGLLLTAGYADCIPVYLYDPINLVIGIAHCGWKGTVKKCALATLKAMQDAFGSKPSDIKAAIGPGISYCCFETGSDVYEYFKAEGFLVDNFSKQMPNGKYYIDLKSINKDILNTAGVSDIDISDECTCCGTDKFYSYRKEKGKTGRMNAGIILL